MVEFSHSNSMSGRAVSSPRKRDDAASSPLAAENVPDDDANGRDRHSRDRMLSFSFNFKSMCFGGDSRFQPRNSKISLFLLLLALVAGLISVVSILNRLNAPYLCRKDGIVLHCPRVNESPSLWENPYSATISWKPCAERRKGAISDHPPETETNGYIFIHAEGGLNQQRIAHGHC